MHYGVALPASTKDIYIRFYILDEIARKIMHNNKNEFGALIEFN